HRSALIPNRDLGEPVCAKRATRVGFGLKLLRLAGRENFVELATNHILRLTMENLEDRAPDCLVARNALHSGFALPIPDSDPVVAIDYVEAEGKKVQHGLGEELLLLYLAHPDLQIALEPARPF